MMVRCTGEEWVRIADSILASCPSPDVVLTSRPRLEFLADGPSEPPIGWEAPMRFVSRTRWHYWEEIGRPANLRETVVAMLKAEWPEVSFEFSPGAW